MGEVTHVLLKSDCVISIFVHAIKKLQLNGFQSIKEKKKIAIR